jgi:FKBP-type peptidyl-prolyl cis-trans isomerase FkpA
MRFFFFLLLAGCATGLAAQQSAATLRSAHGYPYTPRIEKNGPKPTTGQTVYVHIDTYVGDSLMQSTRPTSPLGRKVALPPEAQFKAVANVPAVIDAAVLMGVGDSLTIWMPLDSFLLSMLPPRLKSEKDLRYEVVLLRIQTDVEANEIVRKNNALVDNRSQQMAQTLENYRSKRLESRLTKTRSGLQMLIETPGEGRPVREGEVVRAHYFGSLLDGTSFDNSYQRGQPLEFPVGVGQMIAGFDEGVQLLRHGGRAYLFIPAKLGYGDQPNGRIPANSTLVFYVEVL